MRIAIQRFVAALLILALGGTAAHARFGVGVGISIGVPGPRYYRPYCHGRGYYYYRPYYPVYAGPGPYIVQPVPAVAAPVMIVQPAPVYPAPVPAPVSQVPAPTAPPVVARSVSLEEPPANADYYIDQLRATDERVRAEAALQVGRLKDRRAVMPLTQALTGDPSPAVRDAAARALGLIGDPSALNAVQRAAQADEDRDVRHSAAFAAEILRSNLRGR